LLLAFAYDVVALAKKEKAHEIPRLGSRRDCAATDRRAEFVRFRATGCVNNHNLDINNTAKCRPDSKLGLSNRAAKGDF
jgi:hypothetical protein